MVFFFRCLFNEDALIIIKKRSYMPSKDSNQNEQNKGKVVQLSDGQKTSSGKKVKQPLYFSKIVTYVILAVISIVMIVGVVVPSLGSSSRNTSLTFGSYNGEDIVFTPGNYFYRQYQNQAQQANGSDENAAYQIWSGAYQNTVFHTAMNQIADKAGIIVAEETLNQAIIDSGAYDKDGKFDIATYESASVETKSSIKKQYEDMLPTSIILSDMQSMLAPEGELEYIKALGEDSKAFEYVVFNAGIYPEALTREFAMNNPAEFTLIDISVLTVGTEEEALEIKSKIEAGDITFADAAINNSLDALAQDGGKAGVFYLHELKSNFEIEEEVNELFSTAEGTISRPFSTGGAYAVYQVEQKPFAADFTDEATLDDVRAYIQTYNPEITTDYVKSEGERFLAEVKGGKDFTEAAQEFALDTQSVGLTPVDVKSSSYLIGFQYTDSVGYLAALNSDVDAMKSLYSLDTDEVSALIESNGSYIVAKVTDSGSMSENSSDYIGMLYDYMVSQQIQQEVVDSIFSSKNFDDNFFSVYLSEIMQVSAN